MRTASVLLVMAITIPAAAQGTDQYGYPPNPSEPPAPSQPPSTTQSPTYPPPPSTPPSSYPPPTTYPSSPPSTSTITPYDPNKYVNPTYNTNYSQTPPPHKLFISPEVHTKWRNSRNLYTAGGVISLLGTGLTISSVIVVAATGYPCDPDDPIHKLNPMSPCNAMSATYDPPKPTDAAPLLSYIGSTTSAFGFILSASGLGWQHSLLRDLGGDTPRGVFYGGTAMGVLGFIGTGVGYLLAFTDFVNPHDQGVAILATTVTAAGFTAISSLLYMIDAGRTKKAFLRLQTF